MESTSPTSNSERTVLSGQGSVGSPGEGPYAIVQVRADEGRIIDLTCRTNGCPTVMAAARATERLLLGRTIIEAGRLDERDLILYMGGIPEGKGEAITRVVTALRSALDEVRG